MEVLVASAVEVSIIIVEELSIIMEVLSAIALDVVGLQEPSLLQSELDDFESHEPSLLQS